MRLIQRFTRLDAHTLDYAYTVDDAASFTSPWSVQFPLTYTDSQGYESTCHEHNYSMRLMLSGARAEEEAAKFVGAFKLVSYECYGPGGGVTTAPYREGSMLYDDSGQMSAHLVNPDRPTPEGTPSEADRAKLYQSYFAYFGRYDVNVYQGVVRHYVEGGLRPGLDDRTLVRAYEFDDDDTRLVLTEKDGDRVVGRVTWERPQ